MKKVFALITLFVLFACGNRDKVSTKVLKESYVMMSTSPCFGACPVYTLHIFDDGTMRYEPSKFTELSGTFTAQLSAGDHKAVIAQLHAVNWSETKPLYRTGYTDLPSAIIRYSETPGDTSTVDFESDAAPERIRQIEFVLDSIRTHTEWVSLDTY